MCPAVWAKVFTYLSCVFAASAYLQYYSVFREFPLSSCVPYVCFRSERMYFFTPISASYCCNIRTRTRHSLLESRSSFLHTFDNESTKYSLNSKSFN